MDRLGIHHDTVEVKDNRFHHAESVEMCRFIGNAAEDAPVCPDALSCSYAGQATDTPAAKL